MPHAYQHICWPNDTNPSLNENCANMLWNKKPAYASHAFPHRSKLVAICVISHCWVELSIEKRIAIGRTIQIVQSPPWAKFKNLSEELRKNLNKLDFQLFLGQYLRLRRGWGVLTYMSIFDYSQRSCWSHQRLRLCS